MTITKYVARRCCWYCRCRCCCDGRYAARENLLGLTAGRLSAGLLLVVVLCYASAVVAQTNRFRIGAGGGYGTYYQISRLIAQSISDWPGQRANNSDKPFTVPGLLGLAQRSNGSVTNVEEINDGLLEAGLAQADVVNWAYHGSGPFAGHSKPRLRAIATLYVESLHLVARRGSGIHSVADLRGRRVSLDEGGSGTLFGIQPLFRAFGLSVDDLQAVYLKPEDAIERLHNKQLDAFFILAGFPINVVVKLIERGDASVVPVDGPAVERLLSDNSLWASDVIPAGVYGNSEPVPTVGVGAQFVVRDDLDEELVYRVTGMLWSTSAQQLLAEGHPKGGDIRLSSALDRVTIPLHTGAQRYYREVGALAVAVPR